MVVLKCPACGAKLSNVDAKLDSFFCMYCGSQIINDDNKHYTIDINQNYRKVDEARLKEAEYNREIKIKKMEQKERHNIRNSIEFAVVVFGTIGLLIGILICLTHSIEMDEKARKEAGVVAESEGKIQVGTSSSSFKGQNYQSVKATLEAAGFTNIECIDLGDAGLIRNKKNSIESVSIGGDSYFGAIDYYAPSDKIIITYH